VVPIHAGTSGLLAVASSPYVQLAPRPDCGRVVSRGDHRRGREPSGEARDSRGGEAVVLLPVTQHPVGPLSPGEYLNAHSGMSEFPRIFGRKCCQLHGKMV